MTCLWLPLLKATGPLASGTHSPDRHRLPRECLSHPVDPLSLNWKGALFNERQEKSHVLRMWSNFRSVFSLHLCSHLKRCFILPSVYAYIKSLFRCMVLNKRAFLHIWKCRTFLYVLFTVWFHCRTELLKLFIDNQYHTMTGLLREQPCM